MTGAQAKANSPTEPQPFAAAPADGPDIPSTYKRAFLTGLAAILPTILTLWILSAAYRFVDDSIARPISVAVKNGLAETATGNRIAEALLDVDTSLTRPAPISTPPSREEEVREKARMEALRKAVEERYPLWFGLLAAVVVVFGIGFAVASLIGQRLVALAEQAVSRLPVVRAIYPPAKQIVDFFLQAEKSRQTFSKVVAVQWPRAGYWAVGFVTSEGLRDVSAAAEGRRFVNVFVPNAPTPMTGYVVLAPEAELIPLSMSVDEAFRYLISGGVIVPPGQVMTADETAAGSLPLKKDSP